MRDWAITLAVFLIGVGGLWLLLQVASADSDQLVINDRPAVEPYWPEPVIVEEDAMQTPAWEQWCEAKRVDAVVISAIEREADYWEALLPDERDGFDAAALVAVLWHETRCRHWDGDRILCGDGGRAIGIGQVHRDPWERHFREEYDASFDLRCMSDNLIAVWNLLVRGGWQEGDEQAQLKALAFYNTGKRTLPNGYARRVHATYREIKAYESAGTETRPTEE